MRSRGFTIEGVIGILILFVALFVLFIYFLKTSRWRSVEYIRTACSNRFTFLLFQVKINNLSIKFIKVFLDSNFSLS